MGLVGMKKQYLTVQVMKLKVTPEGLELGKKGYAVLAGALVMMFAAGFAGGHMLFNLVDLVVPAIIMAVALTGWSVFLLKHVKKNIPSITRLLFWTSVVGITLGFLGSVLYQNFTNPDIAGMDKGGMSTTQ